MSEVILQVAVPVPVRRLFDYLPPGDCEPADLKPGQRLLVPFGRRQLIGVLVTHGLHSDQPQHKLKRAVRLLESTPSIAPAMMELLMWASQYYQHPIGEVMHNALPLALRQERAQAPRLPCVYELTPAGAQVGEEQIKRAPRQVQLLRALNEAGSMSEAQLNDTCDNWRAPMQRLVARGWVNVRQLTPETAPAVAGPPLSEQQQAAVDAVVNHRDGFKGFLLHGVTGSGKTEVYLHCIRHCLEADKQALVLVPEIGLTPQLVNRFRRRLACEIAVLHSGLNDSERLYAWERARQGHARVVIGTRSALFTPLPSLGLIVVDEEHDPSLKQQEGFRYSARDLAVRLAYNQGLAIVLGSATPSMESLCNAREGRYTRLTLSQRAGEAQTPALHLLDVRHQPMTEGITPAMQRLIRAHLERDNQVLLFLNRRGFAPTWLCHDCGWLAQCRRCDAHMIYHQGTGMLRCHHCGAQQRAETRCPACASENLLALGAGTERIETALRELFPEYRVVRIDRDTTRRKGALEAIYNEVKHGRGQILVGTQMLAKGHHLPNVTLVGVLDADQGLFSADFRASERLAQLTLQVAGRAGRASDPGEVYIQTHHPEHPLWPALVRQDYDAIADTLLEERAEAQLPPYAAMTLFRAEAVQRQAPLDFLQQLAEVLRPDAANDVALFGPVPAPMERRAGRYRAQLIVQCAERATMQNLLRRCMPAIEALKHTRNVRWSVDVDPVDTF